MPSAAAWVATGGLAPRCGAGQPVLGSRPLSFRRDRARQPLSRPEALLQREAAEQARRRRRTQTHGQPVFAMARPDGRQVWVNFAHPLNDTIQVIDTLSKQVIREFKPGPAVLHMEFTPRGHEVWVSVRDAGKVMIYDAQNFEKLGEIDAESPSGIFFTARAHRTGL